MSGLRDFSQCSFKAKLLVITGVYLAQCMIKLDVNDTAAFKPYHFFLVITMNTFIQVGDFWRALSKI